MTCIFIADTKPLSIGLSSVAYFRTGLLGNHWLDNNGQLIQWSDGRVDLPQDLASGEMVELSLNVTVPMEEGYYLLVLDLVEEGVTWFKQKGSKSTKIKVQVVTSSETPKSLSENVDIYLSQGNSQFKRGNTERAIISYQKALLLNPQEPDELYQNLGDAFFEVLRQATAPS